MNTYKIVEKWANKIPWKPEDIKISVRKGCVGFTPKDGHSAKYDRETYDLLSTYISSATCFASWLKEEGKLK